MFRNFFKFISVVFLLAFFLAPQSSFAQSTLIDPTGDGGFANGATFAANGWTESSSANNPWVVGTAVTGAPFAGNVAYVSNDAGVTNAYTNTASSLNYIYRDVTVPAGETKIIMTFNWICNGESTYDLFQVFSAPTSITPVGTTTYPGSGTSNVPSGIAGATFVGYGNLQTTAQTATFTFPSSLAGTTFRVIIAWKNDTSGGTNPPAAIDNISLVSGLPVPLVGGNIYPINGTQNPPTSFASITTALAYMATDGISGSGQVVFELNTGYAGEPGPVFINAIPGTSATLGVTFRPATGYTALTSIPGAASPNQHAIKLNACSYVTLDGRAGGVGTSRDWTVRVTGSGASGLGQMAVRMDNTNGNMTGNAVRYLIMEGEAANATGAIFQITGGSTYTISNIIIENNLIQSTSSTSTSLRGYGITLAVAINVGNTGIIVRNNDITMFHGRGINLTGGFPGIEVYGNNIYHTVAITATTPIESAGIYFSTSSSPGAKIYSNYIYDLKYTNGTTSINGIQLVSSNATGIVPAFFNNRISIGDGITATTVPIYGFNYSSTTATYPYDVYFNSVLISGTATAGTANSAAFRKAAGNVFNLKNNIFYNARTNSGASGTHWAIAVNNTTFTSINNNDYFANGTGGVLGTTDGTTTGNKTTLALWKAAVPADINSVSQNPNYLAGLKIDTTIPTQLESGGTPVVYVTTDFEGNARNATTPDIGADEFAGQFLDLTPPVIVYTPLLNTNSLAARNIVVNVTDPGSGVPIVAPGWPNLYWKKGVLGLWTAVTPTGVAGSDYTYSFGGGVATGDTVFYYVVAQDTVSPVPNVGAYPSLGAGGFTFNPPAAAIPPTTPNSYIISQAALAGNYTVGLTLFNQVTGMNIYFDKVITKVMKEVEVEVPVVQTKVEKGQELQADATETSYKPQTIKKLMEVEEISWVPMQNGQPYLGDLYIKKVESPEFNYPVGTDGIYATITAAVADLNLRGVGGATTFLLNDASYTTGETYPIVIKVANEGNFPTATNTVTIKPNTGVTALVQGAAAAGQIFKILNSYVTIDGSNAGGTDRSLTIENTSVTSPQVVVIGSTGTTPIIGATLRNCILINGITSSSAVVVSDGTAPGTAGYFSNITIQNNSIQKAYMGIYNITVMAPGNGSGLLLTGNDLNTAAPNNITLVGIYVQGVDGATVSNNYIGNYTTTYTANITGIWFATGTVNSTISNNTISTMNLTTAGPRGIVVTSAVDNANVSIANNTVSNLSNTGTGIVYGIDVFSTTGGVTIEKNKISNIKNTNSGGYSANGIMLNSTLATTNNFTVSNNFIWDIAGYGYGSMTTDNGYGINLASGSGINLYFNTVALATEQTSATGNPAALIINSAITAPASLDIRDNIFATFQTVGAQRYALLCNAANTVFSNINYNDWYSLGPNLGYIVRNRLDLDSLRAGTGQDLQSISGDPKFVSNTDLHINTLFNVVDAKAQYLAAVPTDIDGNARNASTPDIGADEYVYVIPTVDDPTGVSATAISGTQIDVAFTPNGNNNNVVIVYNLSGTFTTPSGTPSVGGTLANGEVLYINTASPYNHTGLNPQTIYYYKLFSYDGSIYSSGVAVNATTPCNVVTTFPLTDSFDGTTFPPDCWANTQVSGSGLWARVTAGVYPTCAPHSGTGMAKYACWDFSAGAAAILVTPQITFPSDNYQIVFWMYRDNEYSTTADRVEVYYNTSANLTGATLLGTINRSRSLAPIEAADGWYQYKFYVPTASSGNAYILFDGISQYGNNIYVDDVTIEQIPNFPIFSINPTSKDYGTIVAGNSVSQDFTISNSGAGTLTINDGGITLTGADVSQFTLGSVTYPINLTTGQSTVVTVSFTPTTAGFKNAALQIVHNAAGTPATVALTGRALPAGVLFEDFTAVNALDRWTVVNLDGGANAWERLTSKFNSSPASAGSYYEGSTLQNNDWLISPKLTVASGDSLMFWHSIQSATYPESLYVKIGTTNDPTTGTWTNLDIIVDNTTTWKLKKYALETWAGQNVYVAFVNRSLDAWVLYVDDIVGPLVYVPAVDLAFSEFYQSTGLPTPRPGEKFTDYKVTLNNESIKNDKKPISVLSNDGTGVPSTIVVRITPISYDGIIPFNPELANIGVKGVINNVGTNAASYNLGWTVGGVAQTPYVGPSVPSGGADTANLSYTSTAIGTFLTPGTLTVTADENLSNNDNEFRMRVYPDAFTRTIYDRGDNVVDTYVGWGSPTIRMKAGVRFTAPATDIKLAGLDYICRTESVPTGTWEIQVRDTSSSSGAPGAVLYSKVYSAADYFAGAGDYIFFPFDNNAPVITAGDEYWITVKAPLGVLYAGGAHNTGFTAGHSYYEGSTDTTVWNPLILTTERAWIMRSVEVAAATTFSFSVNVTLGWNIVSAPGLHPTNQNIETWWPHESPIFSVWEFNGTQYVARTVTTPGEGYWMNNTVAETYNYSGIQIVPHNPVAVTLGWNLIGGYELSPSVANLKLANPQIALTVWGFNGVQYVAATNIVPGYGYWVYVTSAGTITIPDALSKGGEVVEIFKEDWGRIILTDAAGLSYTLYAVKGEVDLNQYEMPPMPPAGMFDIRFSSGRIAEDINSAIKTIDMSGVTYPLTVRAEGMDIRLQDITGKQINQNLKSGEDVIISDATIQKLMVSGELIPDKYALEQNYPNPFNPSTVIEFSLPENVGNVKLSIYNVLGEVVAELVNTALVAGKYSYQWNAQNVATGMYIYELRTDKFVSVKKMLLLK